MNVLTLNWRDPEHPEAGGAEVHIREILTRWLPRGARVTYLASSFPGAQPETEIDGIRVLRRGSWWNANWAAAQSVRGELREEKFDLIIEDLNKLPYFSPLYAPAPVLTVVPHLFGTTVFAEASWPTAMGVWLHEAFLPAVYGKSPFLVISDSTREDLQKRGFRREQIAVSYCGLDHERYRPGGEKTPRPTIVFVGRLRRYKGVDFLLDAFAQVLRTHPEAKLSVVGDGPHRSELQQHAARLGVGESIEFTGFVPFDEKVSRMQSAWVSALPSPKEGWGLTVVESNACGTPVVASRSPGLVDSVRDGETGLLVPHGDVKALADAIRRVLDDSELRDKLRTGGLQWAKTFTWDRASDEAWQVAQAAREGAELPQFSSGSDSAAPGSSSSFHQRTA